MPDRVGGALFVSVEPKSRKSADPPPEPRWKEEKAAEMGERAPRVLDGDEWRRDHHAAAGGLARLHLGLWWEKAPCGVSFGSCRG